MRTPSQLRFAAPLLLPASYLLGILSGSSPLLLGAAVLLFVATPVLDEILPRSRASNAAGGVAPTLLPTLYVALHAACLLAMALALRADEYDLPTAVAATLSLGAVGGVSITASHELLHGSSRWGRRMGRVGMHLVAYGHFEIAHLYGHHRHACTARDHSTAWRGESLYGYLKRTIPGCFAFAREEAARRRGNDVGRKLLSPRLSLVSSSGIALLLALFGGPGMLAVFLGHAAIAVLLLESTSYVEHYGLIRRTDDGASERFTSRHAWDSEHAMSNALLFHLPRHADHHLHCGRDFLRLEADRAARALPTGYPSMILLSMVPALWRRVMDPLLAEPG